jgi:outer membrane biosynthesis protein TonB
MVATMVLWTAGGLARGEGLPSGLAGLDVSMNGTGRVGNPWQRSKEPIVAPNIPDPAARGSASAAFARPTRNDEQAPPLLQGDLSEQEYQQTDVAVGNCRVEVARRRQVAPAHVAAGTVLLRFTVETSGRVRDAEAVSETNTDLELAACAKRVLSDWRFAKHTTGEITVERMYQLASGSGPGQR